MKEQNSAEFTETPSDLLPIGPFKKARLYLMVARTDSNIMDQFEFEVTAEQQASLRKAIFLMVHLSIWEDGDIDDTRDYHLLFEQDMCQPQRTSDSAFPSCESAPPASRPG